MRGWHTTLKRDIAPFHLQKDGLFLSWRSLSLKRTKSLSKENGGSWWRSWPRLDSWKSILHYVIRIEVMLVSLNTLFTSLKVALRFFLYLNLMKNAWIDAFCNYYWQRLSIPYPQCYMYGADWFSLSASHPFAIISRPVHLNRFRLSLSISRHCDCDYRDED